MNDRTHECLGDAPVRCRFIGAIQVVGRQTPVRAWEIVNADFPQEAIDLSAALSDAVTDGNQAAAAKALASLRAIPGQEGFVARWADMVEGPAEGFGGPLQLVEK